MARTSMKEISSIMKGMDLCMLNTVGGRGITSARPMSNNGDVDYNGTSYFFTYSDTKMISEIKKNPHVSMSYVNYGLLSKTFISVNGKARLSKDRSEMTDHWTPDLDLWFKDGIKTPGLVMIEVEANHIKYWNNNKQAELTISKKKIKH